MARAAAQARLKEVTINDEMDNDPKLAKEIDAEIMKGSYY
jgi:hypothetical protein